MCILTTTTRSDSSIDLETRTYLPIHHLGSWLDDTSDTGTRCIAYFFSNTTFGNLVSLDSTRLTLN